MRTTTPAGLLLLAALLSAVGCSNNNPPAATSPTQSTTTTASPAPTKLASTANYADAVAQFAGDIRSRAADLDGCVAVQQCASTAIITNAVVGTAKESLGLVVPTYGAPPAEIASLVADTDAAFDKAIAELGSVLHEGDDPTAAIAAMDALAALMDRWTPYGV